LGKICMSGTEHRRAARGACPLETRGADTCCLPSVGATAGVARAKAAGCAGKGPTQPKVLQPSARGDG
jgi:hypothetical protein